MPCRKLPDTSPAPHLRLQGAAALPAVRHRQLWQLRSCSFPLHAWPPHAASTLHCSALRCPKTLQGSNINPAVLDVATSLNMVSGTARQQACREASVLCCVAPGGALAAVVA